MITAVDTLYAEPADPPMCPRCGGAAPAEGFEHLIDAERFIVCRTVVPETNTSRAHVDEVLRRGLGPELWNRLWGPELERLGAEVDELCRRVHDDAVRETRVERAALLLEALHAVEWTNCDGEEWCRACGSQRDAGHDADCVVARAVKGAEAP